MRAMRQGYVFHPQADVSDEIAALQAIDIALSEVADGSSYVWHAAHGRLSGVIHPTSSFRDRRGSVCRHIVITLSAAARSGRIEGIACRLNDGSWQLAG
jgi:surface antigen